MGTNQSSYLFCPFVSLFGQIIKMLALLTPSSSYEAQREAISDFGWLERFTAIFTVTDETDMQKNTPFKIAPFLLP